ncbi:IST1 like [Quillaja saponaria]|uniref:IST1 like n=1 Tax=Quillaja saponaria TaxID=32244 RepID=A0AAD7Q3B6_QUISA|nr:IST1 like [Quillaja saponaria]
MLDGLLGRGIAAKSKSLIKLIKSRIDVIRRKRNATQKFLRKDIADLLASGLDVNAFGRAAGLLAELTLSSCYDFVEQSCDFVLKHLSVIQKQRECPEECREAISSLMFAAARFSDLPELRDLRQIFQERYGNALEYYVNQEFVENLTSRPTTLEKKVQLLKHITVEFSLEWDFKVFEQKMSRTSPIAQGHNNYDPNNVTDYNKSWNSKGHIVKGDKYDVFSEKRLEIPSDGHISQNGKASLATKRDGHNHESRAELSGDGYSPINVCETFLKRDNHGNPSQRRQDLSVKNENRDGNKGSMLKPVGFDGHRFHNDEEVASKRDAYNNFQSIPGLSENKYKRMNCCETIPKWDNRDNIFWGKQKDVVKNEIRHHDGNMVKPVGLYGSSQGKRVEYVEGGSKQQNSRENTTPQRDIQETVPYGKPDTAPSPAGLHVTGNGSESFAVSSHGVRHDIPNSDRICRANIVSSHAYFEGDGVSKDPSVHNRADASTTSDRIQLGSGRADHERQHNRNGKVSRQGHEEGLFNRDDSRGVPLPKPRSFRRRHSKSRSGHNVVDTVEDSGVVKRISRSRTRNDSRRGLQILFDDEQDHNYEEERIIDKLLIHYSKKPSTVEPGKARRKSKSRHAHHMDSKTGESPENGSRDAIDEESETVPPPARSVSLSHEQSVSSELTKVFNRAASFQPDRSSAARHVHPKLPDYDDLASRFAALKGK